MTSAKLNKIYTKFVFLGVFPDESTVEVVFSFLAGRMGDGAECPGGTPAGQNEIATLRQAQGRLARDDGSR